MILSNLNCLFISSPSLSLLIYQLLALVRPDTLLYLAPAYGALLELVGALNARAQVTAGYEAHIRLAVQTHLALHLVRKLLQFLLRLVRRQLDRGRWFTCRS